MALLTACTAKNRIVERELVTTYTRETVYPGDTAKAVYGAKADFAYFAYTRKRTKEYKYIGLTQSAAKSEAQRIWLAYRRECWRWELDAQNRKWTRPFGASTSDFVVEAATVAASRTNGEAWEVSVSVNEEITIPYRSSGADTSKDGDPLTPWTEFETDPSLLTSMFRGVKFIDSDRPGAELDFDYDV